MTTTLRIFRAVLRSKYFWLFSWAAVSILIALVLLPYGLPEALFDVVCVAAGFGVTEFLRTVVGGRR